jgi:drug/metabolite transporter (DMT)-like permease
MNPTLVLIALLSAASSAHAYIDPGSGMLAIQGLIALAIGILAFVRHPIRTLRSWRERWRRRNSRDA